MNVSFYHIIIHELHFKKRKQILANLLLCFFLFCSNVSAQHLKKPKLIFQNGFEGTSKVVYLGEAPDLKNAGANNDGMTGDDNTLKKKSNWAKDLDLNPDGGKFLFAYTGGDSTKRYAKVISEPGNPKNHVLYFWLNDSWLADANLYKARVQADIYAIKKPLKEFYQTVRVFLHNDFAILKKYPQKITWLTISEFWNNEWWVPTEKFGFRVTLGIGKPTADESELNFILNAQDAGMKEVWNADNTNSKVPIGKWFTMDYYFKEGNIDTGRFWMAITPEGGERQVVFDVTNFTHNTHDTNPGGLTAYHPLKLYTSKEVVAFMRSQNKTLQIYWDDFKLWKDKKPDFMMK